MSEQLPPTKADIYRKAAEVIVRDGKVDGGLVGYPSGDALEGGVADELPETIADTGRPVCAIGACFRAEYELNGNQYPQEVMDQFSYDCLDWDRFVFHTFVPGTGKVRIWAYNDMTGTSAEDIALAFKQHAEGIGERE